MQGYIDRYGEAFTMELYQWYHSHSMCSSLLFIHGLYTYTLS